MTIYVHPLTQCRTCKGLGYIPINSMCPGCIRLYGHRPKMRIVKRIKNRRIAQAKKKLRRWQDKYDRWISSVFFNVGRNDA